jgi:RimJ/RimL family protein N-acetyltransferase
LVDLSPLRVSDLGEVERWFDDTQTQKWLGGRDWPSQSLRLAGKNRYVLLAMLAGSAVGLIDVETYPAHRASFAIVVAPSARRHGMGRRVLEAAIDDPRVAEVVEWFAGIERGNEASRRLVESIGFRPVTGEDADGFTYYALGDVGVPWSLPG